MILGSLEASDYFWKQDCFSGQFKFFTSIDKYLYPENSVIFFVIELDSIPVCVSHLAKDYDFSQKTASFRYQNPWKINFISTRLGFEGRGFAKTIIDEIFDWAGKKEVTLLVSGYSQTGWKKIRPYLRKMSRQTDVPFLDFEKII